MSDEGLIRETIGRCKIVESIMTYSLGAVFRKVVSFPARYAEVEGMDAKICNP